MRDRSRNGAGADGRGSAGTRRGRATSRPRDRRHACLVRRDRARQGGPGGARGHAFGDPRGGRRPRRRRRRARARRCDERARSAGGADRGALRARGCARVRHAARGIGGGVGDRGCVPDRGVEGDAARSGRRRAVERAGGRGRGPARARARRASGASCRDPARRLRAGAIRRRRGGAGLGRADGRDRSGAVRNEGRGARPPVGARPEPLRAAARRRLCDRRSRCRQPEQHAAGRGDDARPRARRAGSRRDAGTRGLGRARGRAADARPAPVRRRGDVARVHVARGRRLPGLARQRRVLGGSSVRMTGADAVLRSLEAEGVDVMFGLPGGAILPTYDALARGTTVRHVLARHEQGAGHMAEGYARASGRVGVAIATSGPGATNLVTPIADAWMDSTPLVCITGQVRSHLIGTDAFQECDITGITIPIVKHSWLVKDVKELPHVIKAAFHIARTGRCGPVLVDIPRDVQEAELDFEYPETVDLPGWRPPRRGHPRQIREAATRIAAAERPVLYVGGGVLNANACTELLELAELGRLPVITTLMAKSGFPETHGLHFGWPGMHGPKWSNWAMNKCDVLVAVGARFDDRVTGKVASFAPGATVVHFDIDAAEIDKVRYADVPVVGPLKSVLADLNREIGEFIRPHATEPWLSQLERWREEFPLRYGPSCPLMRPQPVLETLQRLTAGRDDVVWTTGVGQHQMWAMQYLLCDRPRSFVTSGGLGTMGFGVPAAIGPKAARPDATVVCVDGDGCFQMTGQELATAVLEELPIVVVVVNNGYLGMVTQWQTMFFGERHSQVRLTHAVPDYA